jgi:hypothetical protein
VAQSLVALAAVPVPVALAGSVTAVALVALAALAALAVMAE